MDVLKIPAKVKLNYREAILQVHRDKVGSKNLTPDRQMLAELIFDELQNECEVFVAEQERKPRPAGSVQPKKSAGGMGSAGAFGNANPGAGIYNGMGRDFGMNGMGGGFGMGRGGMGGMGAGMNNMGNMGGGMGGIGRGGYGNMYGAQASGARPFEAGRVYGMGMNQQQRR